MLFLCTDILQAYAKPGLLFTWKCKDRPTCQCIIHEKQVNYTTHVLYKGITENSKPVDFLVKLN